MKKIIFTSLHLYIITSLLLACNNSQPQATDTEPAEPSSPEFSADSAYAYVAAQCAFGPRVMGSEAHEGCGKWLVEKFSQFGAKVWVQEGDSRLYDGTPIRLSNIIAVFGDSLPGRLQVSSHWDSRPWADNDPDASFHHTPIDGANDGASGVGVMLELARQFHRQHPEIGVELVCWDAEDCGTPQWAEQDDMLHRDESSTWCLGSQYWALSRNQGAVEPWNPSRSKYIGGILLDMVGGRDSRFLKEYSSLRHAPHIVDKVWTVASRLGYGNYFRNEDGGGVTDDHLQVIKSGIPCIDIICSGADGHGFADTWHTMDDNLQNIDPQTLKAVGQTLMEVIYTL